jgi:2-polyprenyl-6-methoxyphenol hydroxylase-like FAD-dependent oxidoreductase
VFFNRYGQFVYREPRGRHAGYELLPELGIHRGRLHRVLFGPPCSAWTRAQCTRATAACVWTSRPMAPRVHFAPDAQGHVPPSATTIVVACDSVNSAVRRQFYPQEELAFGGINTWRGDLALQAHPHGQELSAHRLGRYRQDGDLSHRG